MRRSFYLAAVAIVLGLTTQTFAQGGGGGGGTAGSGGGFGGGTGGSGGFGGSSGGSSFGTGGSNSFSGSSGGSFSGSGNTLLGGTGMTGGTTSTVPGRTGAGGRTIGGGGVSISQSNFLSATYANPLYPGRPGSTSLAPAAGGFGQPSFGNTTTTNRTATGRAGRAGGTATVNSGLGQSGTATTPITFAAEVRFPVPAIQGTQVQTDLQQLINRTSILKQPGDVSVEVQGTTVILRGRVADEDERRLVEGMVRLEPGVHNVRNELTIPKETK